MRTTDVLTAREAEDLLPELVDSIGWQADRLRTALCALYGEGLPSGWADALGLLREARRRLLRALVGPGSAGEMHPTDTGPGWTDEDGRPAVIVRCAGCGQPEWWSPRECDDHGKCRAQPGPCWCEGAEGGDGHLGAE